MKTQLGRWRSAIEELGQGTRRIVAVAAVAGMPLAFGWTAFWHETGVNPWFWGPALIVFGAATGFGALVLYMYVRDRANTDARLDERERQLRDRAWMLSYQFLSGVVTLVVIYVGVTVLGFGRAITLDWQVATDFVLLSVVLIPLLPVAALAWIEPDAPAEA